MSSALINLISGVRDAGWREDEMVKGADEKTGKGCATQLYIFLWNLKHNHTASGSVNTINDIASCRPILN